MRVPAILFLAVLLPAGALAAPRMAAEPNGMQGSWMPGTGLLPADTGATTSAPAAKVCAFQQKKGSADMVSDASAVADELNADSVETVAAAGIPARDENAEARKRGCTWIVTVWRQKPLLRGPAYPGDETLPSVSTINTMMRSEVHRDLIEFNLRRTGSRKATVQGYSQDAAPFTKIAGRIAKKLAREN